MKPTLQKSYSYNKELILILNFFLIGVIRLIQFIFQPFHSKFVPRRHVEAEKTHHCFDQNKESMQYFGQYINEGASLISN